MAMIGPLTEMVQLMFSMSQGSTRERERVSERERVCERETETDRVRVRELSIDMKIKVVQHVLRESEFECGKRMKYVINVLQFIMM